MWTDEPLCAEAKVVRGGRFSRGPNPDSHSTERERLRAGWSPDYQRSGCKLEQCSPLNSALQRLSGFRYHSYSWSVYLGILKLLWASFCLSQCLGLVFTPIPAFTLFGKIATGMLKPPLPSRYRNLVSLGFPVPSWAAVELRVPTPRWTMYSSSSAPFRTLSEILDLACFPALTS